MKSLLASILIVSLLQLAVLLYCALWLRAWMLAAAGQTDDAWVPMF